jgi:hypothetical protein
MLTLTLILYTLPNYKHIHMVQVCLDTQTSLALVDIHTETILSQTNRSNVMDWANTNNANQVQKQRK